MIRFACPTCNATFTVGLEKAGKSAKCPKCQTAFLIPDAPAEEASVSPPPPPPPPLVVLAPPPPPPAPVDDGTVEIVPCPRCANRSLVMKEDVNKDIECPNCQSVYKAIRADAPPPPKVETTVGKKSKLAEIGSGKKKDDDEDDRPSKRKRNRDDDDDDDRPSKRRSSSRRQDDDDDEDDDRPSRRRSSSRRRDDDDDDDYDRPRRRRGGSSRRRSGGNGERPVLVTIVAILEFLGAAGSVICGIGLMVAGPVLMSTFMGAADSIPDNPNAANSAQMANAKAGMQGAAAGITGAFICCGVVGLLWGVLQIFGGMGLMKMKRYGQVITWILAVLAIMSALYGGYSSMGVRGGGVYGGGGSLFQLAFGVLAIVAMVKHNDEFE